MGATIFMGLVILFGIGLVLTALYLIINLFNNLPPSKNKLNEDIKKMEADLQPWIAQLVPWDRDEMELFSLNQINQIIKKSVGTTAKGMFTSIYHEPMLAYSYKKYASPNLNAVLYARTAKHEFIYRIKKNKIQIMVDGEALGTLKDDGVLYNPRNKAFASINRSEKQLLPVVVKEREIAHITNPRLAEQANPRAFDLISLDMSEEEEKVFLSLGVLEVIQAKI